MPCRSFINRLSLKFLWASNSITAQDYCESTGQKIAVLKYSLQGKSLKIIRSCLEVCSRSKLELEGTESGFGLETLRRQRFLGAKLF
jgi:hypothetical protein